MPARKLPIREFARAIGVSPTTVSRVMHGKGRISAATREMVLHRIRELGFTPNLNAQRLSRGRTYMVALDFGPWHDYLSHMFFVELTRTIQDVLETHGYGVLLSGPGEVLHRWVKTRAVDGVIVVNGDLGEDQAADSGVIQEIAQTGTPCVVISHHPIDGIPGVGSVVIGLQSGVRQVAQMLTERGHRDIGFIATAKPAEHDIVLTSFRRELSRRGIELSEDSVETADHTPQDGARAFSELMARGSPPTAVFARTDTLAIGALHAAHRLGVRIPEELSLVGHDDVPFAAWTEPPLTTVRIDYVRLAGMAADMLFCLFDEPDELQKPQEILSELVMRDSVSAPRSAVPRGFTCQERPSL